MRLNFNSTTISTRILNEKDEYKKKTYTQQNKKKQPSTVGLFSHVKMLYLQIFRLNPIPDLRSTATDPINRTHLHTRTSTNDTTLIELNDRMNFGIKTEKKLLHSDFTGLLFKSLMDL